MNPEAEVTDDLLEKLIYADKLWAAAVKWGGENAQQKYNWCFSY